MNHPGQANGEHIVCQVTPAQIMQGHYLLARYNTITDFLTGVMVITDRNQLPGPGAGEHVRYALIGTGADKQPGQPLDEFVESYASSWDGATPVNLFFNPVGAGFEKWEAAALEPAGAAGAARAGATGGAATGGVQPAHSGVLTDADKALIDADPRNILHNPASASPGATGDEPPPHQIGDPNLGDVL